MKKHLTTEAIARYRAGALKSVEELLGIEDHLGACAACSDALRAAVGGADASLARKLAPAIGESACLDARLLERYVDGKADAGDVEVVETHIEDCPRCAGELKSLRTSRRPTALRPPPSPSSE
jgi:anti-sigma factor RsiW